MQRTPPEIRILPDDVANKIAAGEVIERPAAVVKELLENSIDAGADRVEIEFKHGGKNFIKIADNGCGMTREQALMSLEMHATSKIASPDDIFKISTFGFRGEAMPSIASVSKFTLRTRPQSSQFGTQVEAYSGEVKSIRDCGMDEGTEIIVENLFCGVPARRKFLKSDNVEASHIIRLCRMYALALPDLSITLIENSRAIFKSERNSDMLSRISRVCGRDVGSKLVELKDCEFDGMRLCGAILAPGESFATSRNICTFINSRPVDCKAVYSAVKEAYEPYIPKGKFAAAFLFLEMDPSTVDVTVHPAKKEVRLKNELKTRDFIREALSRKLSACSAPVFMGSKTLDLKNGNTPRAISFPTPAIFPEAIGHKGLPAETIAPITEKIHGENPAAQFFKSRSLETLSKTIPEEYAAYKKEGESCASIDENSAPLPKKTRNAEPCALDDWRYIGCFKKRLALFENRRGMIMMHISAALKRIHYARIMDSLAEEKPPSQVLLLPLTVKFERADDEFFAANKKTFASCGFGIEDFGNRMYKIAAVPPWLPYGQAESFIRGFVEEGREDGIKIQKRKLAGDAFAKLAVKRIGSAGFTCTEASAFSLLYELLACEFHSSTPDGRPTLKEISEADISKMFG